MSETPQCSKVRGKSRSDHATGGMVLGTFAETKVPRPRVREPAIDGRGEAALNLDWIPVATGMMEKMDSGFGFGILRRSTAYIPVGVCWNDEVVAERE
ncbi:MAG TPA: hypothetical protein VFX47_07705 [Gammaproteobacteria bacterium]|nr:hypothetical protein [Gammaproteobacteria bacterium]